MRILFLLLILVSINLKTSHAETYYDMHNGEQYVCKPVSEHNDRCYETLTKRYCVAPKANSVLCNEFKETSRKYKCSRGCYEDKNCAEYVPNSSKCAYYETKVLCPLE